MGFFSPVGFGEIDAIPLIESMTHRIAHRGPDDAGIWLDAQAGIALGHRRLAILDLSPAGHQPMVSADGRWVIAFNGEIYNHLELRKGLESSGFVKESQWCGHSDTETLLAACAAWGIERALKNLVGMFAFALWDKENRTLHLARDRMGEKPLYYGWQKGIFLFGSELKAMKAHPCFQSQLDQNALTLFFRHSYIPSPWTIYRDCRKLNSGCRLTVQTGHGIGLEREVPYWSLTERVSCERFSGSDVELVDELERRLTKAVGMQMMSDVPLGAFLSGGVDSSTVVALMQKQSSIPVRTFTVGFQEKQFDEGNFAVEVARYLGTDHTELLVTGHDALEVIPSLPEIWDEPFADSSQIPTFLIAKFTRNHVTVSLSGDGGDELFHGYPHYFLAQAIERIPMKRWISMLLRKAPPAFLALLCNFIPYPTVSPRKLSTLRDLLDSPTPISRYRHRMSHWKHPERLVINGCEPPNVFTSSELFEKLDFRVAMSTIDAITYLPDDILVKLDRAAMAVSLETRVPMLDHRVVEFACSLNAHHKVNHGISKWPLRQILYRHVPRTLIDRPKQGFGVPLSDWLRGPLKEWASDLLSEDTMRRRNTLNFEPVSETWRAHLEGRADMGYYLWDVLMFRAWEEAHVP